MRIVVLGAGAVGSVIGGRLHQHRERHGHEITLVARGPHCRAINEHGLTIHDPSGTSVVDVPAVERIDQVPLADGDVVILAMKTQGTQAALDDLVAHAPPGITVACAQNGIENERLALRHFADVQGICVMLPAIFLEPGIVDTHGQPHNAILDTGSYPTGASAATHTIAAAFDAAGFASVARDDVMRWKHTKLLTNLGNVLDALIVEQGDPRTRDLGRAARAEGVACLEAAGLERASEDEDRERRQQMKATKIPGRRDHGSSTFQSFARGDTATEIDWLNGEIVLLGRLHGVPTPVNERLQQFARESAARGVEPRSVSIADLLG